MTEKSIAEIMKIMEELDIEELRGVEIEGDIELEIESSILVPQMSAQISEAAGGELSSAIQHLSNILKMIGQ